MISILSVSIYICVYGLSALFLNACAKSKNKRNGYYLLAILLPCLLAAIRYEVGTDYQNYYYYYINHSSTSFFDYYHLENKPVLGIWIFSKVAGLFQSFNLFLFLFALATYIPISHFILKHSKTIPVSLASFIYLMTIFTSGLNIMKQTVAMSFIIVSLDYIKEKKIINFIFFILMASMFHSTAWVFLPFYFIQVDRKEETTSHNVRNGTLINILIVVSCIAACFFVDKITSLFGTHYAEYFSVKGDNANKSFYISVVWLVIILFLRHSLLKRSEDNKLYIVCYCIGVIFGSFGFSFVFGKRIAIYFSSVRFLLESQIPFCCGKYQRVVHALLVLYTITYFVISYVLLKQSGIIPYQYKIW